MEELLQELRLDGINESLNFRLTEVTENNLSHQDFLRLILEDESLYRKNRKSIRLKKRARFNDQSLLEDFEADVTRGVTKTLIQRLSSLNFIEKKENLIFTGGTGAGKSYLAQAIGHRACIEGIEVFYVSVNKLFKEIELNEVAGKYLSFLQRIKKAQVLILDDFGLRNYSHDEASKLYDILEDRYHKGSTIVTSQVKPKGWKTLFEDEVIAEAIVDRICSCALEINLKGESFRKKHLPKK